MTTKKNPRFVEFARRGKWKWGIFFPSVSYE